MLRFQLSSIWEEPYGFTRVPPWVRFKKNKIQKKTDVESVH